MDLGYSTAGYCCENGGKDPVCAVGPMWALLVHSVRLLLISMAIIQALRVPKYRGAREAQRKRRRSGQDGGSWRLSEFVFAPKTLSSTAQFCDFLRTLKWRKLRETEVDAAFALETASYPADEAASLDSLQFRQAHAGEYFYGAFDGSEALRGFVCATVAPGDELTQETMAEHHPDGSTLCIHSVVVASDLRRKGIALQGRQRKGTEREGGRERESERARERESEREGERGVRLCMDEGRHV
eukprot:scaffold1220_cov259-Pinguiococcus_pyrenoidosus.AAC.82